MQYVIRRLLLAVPTLILLTLVTFSLIRLAPGDAVIAQIGDSAGIIIKHPGAVKPALERAAASLTGALEEAKGQGLLPTKRLQGLQNRLAKAKGGLEKIEAGPSVVAARQGARVQEVDKKAIRELEGLRRELLAVWGTLDATKAASLKKPLADATSELNDALQPLEDIRHDLGLDRPFINQYATWFGGFFTGDVAESLYSHRSVLTEVGRTIPITIELALLSMILGIVIAVPIGVFSAIRQDTVPDYLGRIFAISGLSLPNFWLGTMLIVFLAIWFSWIPPVFYHPFLEDPWANLKQMFLPALITGFALSASSMRMIRSSMLEVLREDYIRTAWAKGLTERTVVLRHAMKNAFIPVITIMGSQIGHLLGGAVILESIFGLPGLGRLTVDSLTRRDYSQIQMNVMFIGIIMITANLLVDLSYGWLDPRIRYVRR